MSSKDTFVVLFHSNNHVFWAQEVFKEQGVDHRIVPVPRHLSSDCGYCIRAARDLKEAIVALLAKEGVEVDQVVDE
ncbi:Protein of unknown function [Geoalkalibacter ferrihydriticus]|uniref:Putative Se/S carrier protein-like domain-containing protein n=2 Tax=Geoalkalibacter ferrihydriticus TaxID=392333 RepID=A0A0C2HUQ4_9BACT|nr:DUF3343 domain-containing protein [Geoalkalibacter ferrihydriticus]KIH76547.1 hypothetical protein GFER_10250 [Geoalkalibacter ferrihydriticus DSM 17813]SDM00767.1 Protein of unknown function [Geoalkalibacter ferrihydriticus]